jgi:hypothetical protein
LYHWRLRHNISAWANGGSAKSSLFGGKLRATGDAGGAADGKVRSTEAQTTTRE